MASSGSCSDMKLLKKSSFAMERKPLMLLKDFLREDFSSCSSNGFKSFPRRQCCTTTVRYLLERDLNKARDSTADTSKRLLIRSRSKAAASTTISALQRASEVVLNAVKLLPFPSVKSRSSKGLLPRSLSRKLLKRRFWKRTENGDREIGRWKSFREFLEEKQQPSDSITVTTDTTAITTTTTTTASTSNSNSWSGSEFTSDYLQLSSRNSECFGENDVVGSKKKLPEEKGGVRVGVEAGGNSMKEASATTTYCVEPNAKKGWPTDEEKEQFSPVSVLDCPFDDEDEISSPFRHRLARMEGKKQKLMKNIRRFESLAQLEPMDLEKKIAMSEVDDNELLESPDQSGSTSSNNNNTTFEKIETVQKAEELLDIIKTRIPSDISKYKSDKLFLDFFRDRIEKKTVKAGGDDELDQEKLLKVAADWVNGEPHEVLLDWQVQDGRKSYIRDMEEGGEWRKMDDEKEEVGLEVEVGVWTCLVNELVLDVFF